MLKRSANSLRHILSRPLLALGLTVAMKLAAAPLDRAPSALLRAHAGSPVNWLPWNEATLAKVKREQRPVFLVIGAATSELQRAMRLQTFANADTAAMLNANFTCVLVDREEHPELASLYQAYLRQVKQLSGWPLNLWLTPELLPFEGAAYLPPTEEWGKASFLKVAQQARSAWESDPAGCRARAAEAAAQLAAVAEPASLPAFVPGQAKEKLLAAAEAWRARFDATNGGFAEVPKAPEPELLRFLLRQSPADREAARVTLRAMAASPLRDPLDGGFFRYATDARWRLPYAQKNLADQARIALAFLDAAQGDDAKSFAAAARGALDYALARLARPDGTFAAGEDATDEEFAGYYAWTESEIDEVLGADAAAFKVAHGVQAAGNISADEDVTGMLKGKNLLSGAPGGAGAVGARLLAVRDRRPAPPRDEGANAGTHGLLLAALARAGAQLDDPHFLAAATRLFEAVQKKFFLSRDGELRRSRDFATPAGPADHAALALGCREFARAAHRPEADALAIRLLAQAGRQFFDPVSGRYHATPAALPPGVFVRPLALNAPPSAEALALMAGVPPEQAGVIAAGLLAFDPTDVPAPGDGLLALALLP